MAFRIQKDANLDYLQANNTVSSGSNKLPIYLNSYGAVSSLSFIGVFGSSLGSVDTRIIMPFGGTFTRLFVARDSFGAPSDAYLFTIFINNVPITDTQTFTGANLSAELSFLNPTTIDYAAGDQVAVRITILNGGQPSVTLTLV